MDLRMDEKPGVVYGNELDVKTGNTLGYHEAGIAVFAGLNLFWLF